MKNAHADQMYTVLIGIGVFALCVQAFGLGIVMGVSLMYTGILLAVIDYSAQSSDQGQK